MFLSLIFSFCISFGGIFFLIRYMQRCATYQIVRSDVLAIHTFTKQKKPTMAGIIINVSVLLSCLLFTTNNNIYIKQALTLAISFGIIGFIDDYIKVFKRNTDGFKGSIKLVLELFITTAIVMYGTYKGLTYSDGLLHFPFNFNLSLGILQNIFLIMVIVGSANAVNLTDGLDGLAIIPIILITLSFSFMTTDKEVITLCYSIIGSSIAFFIFNKYPSKIFMGDVGSLFYGSLLAFIAILIRKEIIYAIFGLLFIIEILTSTLQVFLHFFWGKRLFLAAPFHHHLEKSGWSERKIILSLWFFNIICIVMGLLLWKKM